MAAFILLSGAFQGGKVWERVQPTLEARGHWVAAPDLLGMGGDPTPLTEVTLARWAAQIAELAATAPERVLLAGHSRSGLVISAVAELAPRLLRGLIYLAAYLVPSGVSMSEASARFAPHGVRGRHLVFHDDGTVAIRPEAAEELLYNTTEAGWRSRAMAALGRDPGTIASVPASLTEGRFGAVPRAYVICEADRVIPPDAQRAMIAELPCDPVISLACDHSPFYSAPDLMVDALERIARVASMAGSMT